MNRPDEDEGLSPPREPGLGAIEVLVGQEDVLPHLVDQGSPPEAPDAVPGHRAQELTDDRHDDDDRELQRLALARNLPAGQDTPVDQSHLGAHRETHGRDEAQREDGAVSGRLEKLLHSYPAFAMDTAVILGASSADRNSPGTGSGPYLRGPSGRDGRAGGRGRGRARRRGRARGGRRRGRARGGRGRDSAERARAGGRGRGRDSAERVRAGGRGRRRDRRGRRGRRGRRAGRRGRHRAGGRRGGRRHRPSRVLLGHDDPDECRGSTGEHDRRPGQARDPCPCPGAGTRCVVVPGPPHGEPGRGRT